MRSKKLNDEIKEMYGDIPDSVKEDLVEAVIWARKTLRDHEGAGHDFQIVACSRHPGLLVCSFAKPEWAGDHCGDPMETASEAIVLAVCEYLCGA